MHEVAATAASKRQDKRRLAGGPNQRRRLWRALALQRISHWPPPAVEQSVMQFHHIPSPGFLRFAFPLLPPINCSPLHFWPAVERHGLLFACHSTLSAQSSAMRHSFLLVAISGTPIHNATYCWQYLRSLLLPSRRWGCLSCVFRRYSLRVLQ